MSNPKPYISVIIPTYNRAEFLPAALDSVLSQKTKWPYEVIVVDDGSTDDTASVIKKYQDRVEYYKLPHSGLPATPRNFALTKARGNLIAFQDSDDIWVEGKLAKQVPVFEDEAVVLSFGNAEIMTEDGSLTGKLVVGESSLRTPVTFAKLIEENIISTLTVMARKASIEEVGGFSESAKLISVEDYHLWLRLCRVGKLKPIPETLAYYRRHGKNISPSSVRISVKRLIDLNRALLGELREDKPIVKKRLAKLSSDYARLSVFPLNFWHGLMNRVRF